MGRRRDSHRRHRELSFDEETDLLGWGGPAFETDEERRAAWMAHAAELLSRRGGLPGSRPSAYWDYTPDAPRDEDFLVRWGDIYEHGGDKVVVDRDTLWEAQIRFLAERGELRDDELKALADDVPAKATWTEEAQEQARRRLEAALEGLAQRQQHANPGEDFDE